MRTLGSAAAVAGTPGCTIQGPGGRLSAAALGLGGLLLWDGHRRFLGGGRRGGDRVRRLGGPTARRGYRHRLRTGTAVAGTALGTGRLTLSRVRQTGERPAPPTADHPPDRPLFPMSSQRTKATPGRGLRSHRRRAVRGAELTEQRREPQVPSQPHLHPAGRRRRLPPRVSTDPARRRPSPRELPGRPPRPPPPDRDGSARATPPGACSQLCPLATPLMKRLCCSSFAF